PERKWWLPCAFVSSAVHVSAAPVACTTLLSPLGGHTRNVIVPEEASMLNPSTKKLQPTCGSFFILPLSAGSCTFTVPELPLAAARGTARNPTTASVPMASAKLRDRWEDALMGVASPLSCDRWGFGVVVRQAPRRKR